MADQAINALSTKTAPETSDQLLLVGAGEPQLIDYDKLADAILNKITSKNYALDAGQMTLLAALNKLNSDSFSSFCTYGGTYEITSRLVYNTYIVFGMYSLDAIFSIITVNGDATPVLKEFASTGYIRAELVSKGKFNLILQNTSVAIRVIAMDSCTIVNKG